MQLRRTTAMRNDKWDGPRLDRIRNGRPLDWRARAAQTGWGWWYATDRIALCLANRVQVVVDSSWGKRTIYVRSECLSWYQLRHGLLENGGNQCWFWHLRDIILLLEYALMLQALSYNSLFIGSVSEEVFSCGIAIARWNSEGFVSTEALNGTLFIVWPSIPKRIVLVHFGQELMASSQGSVNDDTRDSTRPWKQLENSLENANS